jgi:hypothetical protein
VIGHFIFSNLFIGVVIQNLEEATDEDKRQQVRKRELHIGACGGQRSGSGLLVVVPLERGDPRGSNGVN